MQPLSERAVSRCEQNTLRGYPAWKQAEIRTEGTPEQLTDMQDWIAANKAHLSKLRAQIADGVETCIDSGWPQLAGFAAPEPIAEPVTETPDPLPGKLAEMQDIKTRIDEVRDTPDEPPAEIADLFDPNLTARQNQEALTDKYAELMSRRERHLSFDETSEAMALLHKAERIESGINWNRAQLAEVIG